MTAAVRLVLVGLVAWAGAGVSAAENLIHNGDFEMPSPKNPPPGWTLWGAAKYKDPANFTLDPSDPHGGKVCLRIHHPARTAGYIVSSPDHAIQTHPGMMYTVTFWARADGPTSAVFGFDAYQDLRSYVGAPSPGFFPVAADRQWREFTFEVHEGWDFFARETRLLLLVFKATAAEAEERTLWIDDVAVAEKPSTREGRLLARESLQYPPLEHRLRPGTALEFTLDAEKRLRRATRDAGGISFHRVAGWTGLPYDKEGRYVLPAELEQAIRDLRLPMTRFYAVGDEPFGLEAAIDKAAEMVGRVGVPQDTTVLEFETQGATSLLAPEVWARGVRHSLGRGYQFRHWEITNEPYVQRAKAVFPAPDAYVDHFKAVSRAIRQVHPEGRIGLAIHGRDTAWGNYVLKRAAGEYDFVVGHFYAFVDVNKSTFEDVVLAANWQTLDDVLKVGALVRAYNPGREVYQYDTEWGMHSGGPAGERADAVVRNGNVFGTLHRAVRLIYYAREDILRGASSWEMFTRLRSPGFGILSGEAPDKRFLIYWLYYYFNRHVGAWVLETDGTAPYYEGTVAGRKFAGPQTPALATLSEDGRSIYLIIANGSWTQGAPCRVNLRHFTAARAAGSVLSQSDADARPLVDRREDAVADLPVTVDVGGVATFTVPPHAVVFVTLTRPD